MMDLAELGVVIKETGGAAAIRTLDQVAAAGSRAEDATSRLNTSQGKLAAGMTDAERQARRASVALADAGQNADTLSRASTGLSSNLASLIPSFAAMAASMAVAFGFAAVKNLVDMGDRYAMLEARIKLVTGSTEEAHAVMDKLFGLAQANGQSFEETAALFARIGTQMKDLGVSADDSIKFIDSLQKAIVLGGSSAQEASAGIRQLAQALGKGKLNGDEFVSMMENLPGVSRVLAEALGVPIGALAELAKKGALTADTIVQAFIVMNQKVTEQSAEMPETVGKAMQRLENSVFSFFGKLNEASGFSQALARDITALARTFDLLAAALFKIPALLDEIGNSPFFKFIAPSGPAGQAVKSLYDRAKNFLGLGGAAPDTEGGAIAIPGLSGGAGEADLHGGADVDRLGSAYDDVNQKLEEFRARFQASLKDMQQGTETYHEQVDSVTALTRALKDRLAVSALSDREQAIQTELQRAAQAAMKDGNLLLPEQAAEIRKLVGAIYDHNEAIRDNKKAEAERQQAARQAAAEAKRKADEEARQIEQARSAYDSLAGSLDPAIKKQQDLAKTQDTLNTAVRLGITTQDEAARLLALYTASQQEATDTIAEQKDKVGDYITKLREKLDLDRMSDDERAERLALDEAINLAMQDGNLLTADQIAQIKELVHAHQQLTAEKKAQEKAEQEAQRAAERQADVMLEPLKNMARAVQSLFADVFEQIFTTGKVSIEKLADAGKKIFGQMAGTMLSQLAMQPFMSAMEAMTRGGAGGFLGLPGGAWGTLGMIFGNMAMDRLMPNRGQFSSMGGLLGGIAGAGLGPLGMVGGSLLGNFLGGMIGPGKSSGPNAVANLVLDNDGKFHLGTAGADNGGDAGPLIQAIKQTSDTLNAFMKQYDLHAVGTDLFKLGSGSEVGKNGLVGTPEEIITQVLTRGRIAGEGTVGTILRNTKATDLQGIAADLDFAKIYDDMVKLKPELTEGEAAMKNLKDQFAAVRQRAVDLGLSFDALDQTLAQTIVQMRDKFQKDIQMQILELTDPNAAAVAKLKEQQDQRRRDAIALGADLVQVDKLAALERKKLAEEQNKAMLDQMKAVANSMKSLIDDMKFGDLSPLSAADKFKEVQNKYNQTQALALAGDQTAQSEFEGVARQYLQAAQENFGGAGGFGDVYNQVLASANQILGANTSALGSANDNVVNAVTSGSNNVVVAIKTLTDQVIGLRADNDDLRSALSKAMAGMAAAGGRG